MKKIPKDLDPKLEQILLEKSYEELSKEEQTWVAKHISSSNYEAFRKILLSSKTMFQDTAAAVDPTVKMELLERFRNKHKKPSYGEQLKAIFYHPIPTWKVALAFLALCVAFGFYQDRIVAKQMQDSIYVQHSPEFSEQLHSTKKDTLAKVVNYKSRSVGAEKELKGLFRGVY